MKMFVLKMFPPAGKKCIFKGKKIPLLARRKSQLYEQV